MPTTQSTTPSAHRRPIWLRIMRIAGLTVLFVALTFITLCSAIVWFLTPERLTPIIERLATDNLDANVTIGRAELTFWSSFPNVRVNVSDLSIVSNSLSSLSEAERATLPVDADSLLSLGYFSGSLNLTQLIGGKIALNDVIIDRPSINMLQVNDTIANFNILPPSDPDKPSSPIPNISIHHFAITNAEPVRYRSLADSLSMDIHLNTIDLADKGLPLYQLTIDTNFDSPFIRQYNFKDVRLNLDGDIDWDGDNPYRVALNNLIIKLDQIDMKVNTTIDFHDDLKVDVLDVKIDRVDVNSMLSHVPPTLAPKLSTLNTDMTVSLDMRLLEPFVIKGDGRLPRATINIDIPDCYIEWNTITLNRLGTRLTILTGPLLDEATVDIDHLAVHGPAIAIDIDGKLTTPLSAPTIDGHLLLDIDLNRLNPRLKAMLPGHLDGEVTADARVRINANDITKRTLHRLYADGRINLNDIKYCSDDSLTRLLTRHTAVTFGTRRTVKSLTNALIDSMMIVTIDTDTINIVNHTHHVEMSRFKGNFASTNTMTSADTSRINPFGGHVSLASMRYHSSHDSMTMKMDNIDGLATFSAYQGDFHRPLIGLDVDIDRIRLSGTDFSGLIRDSHLDMQTTLRERRRRRAANDSAAVTTSRPRAMTVAQLDSIGVETVDFNVDNTLRTMLINWDTNAHMTARRGRLRTAGFPLHIRLSNLDAMFMSDSLALNSLDVKIGRTDLSMAGTVAGIRGAINRRRPRPLRVNFDVNSDTLHINQLVQAAVKHSAVDNIDNDDKWDDTEVDKFDRDLHTDSVFGPILIPVNIDAALNIKAANVMYADMDMQHFTGTMLIDRGVLQLSDVSARNAMGSVKLSALYSAPTERDINVGVGMILDHIHLDKIHSLLPHLSEIVPMLESFSGIVTAKVAATVDLNPDMDMIMPSLRAAMTLKGDSLAVVDDKAMRTAAKWLLFKNKRITRIDSVDVNIVVRDNFVQVYPFLLNVDRYRLGITGHSDLGNNLDYHVAVLKSPIPFKFGINIKGSLEKPKIRFGGAKLRPEMIVRRDAIADTIRVNLVNEMNKFFRRGLREARLGRLDIKADSLPALGDEVNPVITPADSLLLIESGLIEVPDSVANRLRASSTLNPTFTDVK